MEASILKDTCKDVKVEPELLLIGDSSVNRSNNSVKARLDISARSVWSQLDRVFFDIRVTHPNTQTNASKPPAQIYNEHEREKKLRYNQRIIEVEKGTFTPMVFSTFGGMGKEADRFHKRLAQLIAVKRRIFTYC